MLKGAKAVSAPRSRIISNRRIPVSGTPMVVAAAKIYTTWRLVRPKRSVARWMAVLLGLLPVRSGGASQGCAGRDVIQGAVERLTDAIAGQVDRPALDFDLTLAVLFDFHFP